MKKMFSMKNELRICVMACLFFLVGNMQMKAQNWRNAPQYHFGVRAGASFTNSWEDSWDGGADTKDLVGSMLGVAFDTKVAKIPFYVETGLYYMNRGLRYEAYRWDNIHSSYDYTENNHSVLVPALISYHAYINKNMSFQPFMGPYLAYGFNDEEIDYGWRMGCGFNAKQFYVNVGVDYGLKDDFEQHEGNVCSVFLTLGWNFRGKR